MAARVAALRLPALLMMAAMALLSPVVPLIRPSTTATRPVADVSDDAVEASSVEMVVVVEMLLASSVLT
jgi:hypothetical protein